MSTSVAAALTAPHTTVLRALTSRLGEVRDVSAAWRERAPGGAGEPALLRALRLVRAECHEWTAADVLRAMGCGEDGELLVGSGLAEAEAAGAAAAAAPGADLRATPLRRGLPTWSWPAYPRAPWVRHLCPVLESLLCSCYEDWLLAALAAARAMLAALAPMLQLASAACAPEDLAAAPPRGEGAGGGGEGEGAGGVEAVAAAGAEEADQRAMRHAAALGAVAFARHAGPVLHALACAAQCPTASTQRAAGQLGADLRAVLLRLQHLTAAAAAGEA